MVDLEATRLCTQVLQHSHPATRKPMRLNQAQHLVCAFFSGERRETLLPPGNDSPPHLL